jgi:hypothetical protein
MTRTIDIEGGPDQKARPSQAVGPVMALVGAPVRAGSRITLPGRPVVPGLHTADSPDGGVRRRPDMTE